MEKPSDEKKPQLNVFTYGKTWATLLEKDNQHDTRYRIFAFNNPTYRLGRAEYLQVIDKEMPNPEHIWQILSSDSLAPSSLVTRINFFIEHADIVLIDTDFLDTAVGHEILRTAHGLMVQAYAVGVSPKASLVSPFYVRGVWYPRDVADIHDRIWDVCSGWKLRPGQSKEESKADDSARRLEHNS